jgi:hypothetical protein
MRARGSVGENAQRAFVRSAARRVFAWPTGRSELVRVEAS